MFKHLSKAQAERILAEVYGFLGGLVILAFIAKPMVHLAVRFAMWKDGF